MSSPVEPPDAYRFRNASALPPAAVPEIPAGWVTGPPDFVGVGFARCGTTRWWRLITEHPHVHRARKELHFFDGLQGCEPSPALESAYHRYFVRPPGTLCGEWTPRYALDHWTPRLLAAAAPDARLLVLVRDPVERFVSALAFREGRQRRSPDNTVAALLRSAYHVQLRHLLRYVERERLLVLQFEACIDDPLRELRRTWAALGVAPDFVPEELDTRVNTSTGSAEIAGSERRDLVRWLEDDVRAFTAECPEIDLARWPNFAHLA